MWKPTFIKLDRVLGFLIASRAVFVEDDITVQRAPEGERKNVLKFFRASIFFTPSHDTNVA